MKIKAIWDRCKVASESKVIFALTDNEDFVTIQPYQKYLGTDEYGKRSYRDTGDMDIYPAFKEDEKFDFNKADYFIRHFGGSLIWKLQESSIIQYELDIT